MPGSTLQLIEPEHLQADAKMSTSPKFSAVICVGEKPGCPGWKEAVLHYRHITKADKLLYLATDLWRLRPIVVHCCLKLEMSWTDPESISIWDILEQGKMEGSMLKQSILRWSGKNSCLQCIILLLKDGKIPGRRKRVPEGPQPPHLHTNQLQ